MDKKIPNLNEDAIRRIIVEPKKEKFSALERFPNIGKIPEREEFLKRAVELLKKCSAFIDVMRFELGEDVDQSDLERQVNEFLKKFEK